MSLRERTRPGLGIVEPCLQSPAKAPPSGPGWLHEIKHDGFRILARRNRDGVRLYTRNGCDFASRFPQIVEAVSKLKVRSCFIDARPSLLMAAACQTLICSAPGGTTTPPCCAPSI
jgi:ATP-dependent DNA ligase